MNLDDYFDFLGENDIRIKGTRVGIETVLDEYLNGRFPEEIVLHYPSLSLEQVYAAITYYLHYRERLNAYLNAWREHSEEQWEEQERNPPEVVKRLRRIIEKRQAELLTEPGRTEPS